MNQLIKLHFVSFIEESPPKAKEYYIDSVCLEPVFVPVNEILVIKSYFCDTFSIPVITSDFLDDDYLQDDGEIQVVVNNYDGWTKFKSGSEIRFKPDMEKALKDSLCNYIHNKCLGIGLVMYESPKEIMQLIQGEEVNLFPPVLGDE